VCGRRIAASWEDLAARQPNSSPARSRVGEHALVREDLHVSRFCQGHTASNANNG
jgi:DNA-directed RNA polymerase subunit N (RpoN/RPB10)